MVPESYRDAPFAPLPRAETVVAFRVGELRIRLEGFPVADEPFLPAHYPDFHASGAEAAAGEADMTVSCRVDEAAAVLPSPAQGEPPTVTVDEPSPNRVVTRSHWHEADLDYVGARGTVTFSDLRYLPFRISLENFLRVAFANLLVRREACLLHAAAVVRDGRAHVFFGLSGSGKSRIVELSRPSPALSDDLVSLRVDDAELVVERVPFFGEYPATEREAGRYPVASLLHLVRGKRHELVELSRAVQTMRLRSCLPFLNPADERALAVIASVLRARPVRELHFRDDDAFWQLLSADP